MLAFSKGQAVTLEINICMPWRYKAVFTRTVRKSVLILGLNTLRKINVRKKT
jgi:hypothetical protein